MKSFVIYIVFLLSAIDASFLRNYHVIGDPSSGLRKCIAFTHSHIQEWHGIDESGFPYVDCHKSGEYQLFESDFIDFRISIDEMWIVDFNIVFTDGTPLPLCSVRTRNFQIFKSADCDLAGILVNMTTYAEFRTVSIIHPQANVTVIVTHNEIAAPLHFNINLWATSDHTSEADELCTSAISTCVRKLPNMWDPQIDQTTAEEICRIYVDTFLQKLSNNTEPSRRKSAHYNMTIENVRRACAFDVQITGISQAAMGSMEALLVEDLTSACDKYDDVQAEFERKIQVALAILHASNEEADKKVQQYFETTTTTVTVSTMTTTSTNSQLTTNFTNQTSTPVNGHGNKELSNFRAYVLLIVGMIYSKFK